jgi:hypothetical protein
VSIRARDIDLVSHSTLVQLGQDSGWSGLMRCRSQWSFFKGSEESGPVDVGVGRFRPIVSGTLVKSWRRKPMGGGESSCEVVGDDSGVGDA